MLYGEKNNRHTHVPREKKIPREEEGLKKLMPIPNHPLPPPEKLNGSPQMVTFVTQETLLSDAFMYDEI